MTCLDATLIQIAQCTTMENNRFVQDTIPLLLSLLLQMAYARKIWSLCIGRGSQAWNTLRVDLERKHGNRIVGQC